MGSAAPQIALHGEALRAEIPTRDGRTTVEAGTLTTRPPHLLASCMNKTERIEEEQKIVLPYKATTATPPPPTPYTVLNPSKMGHLSLGCMSY